MPISITDFSETRVFYVGIQINDDTNILQENYIFSGENKQPSFTTTKPNSIRLYSGTKDYNFKLYYSDLIHLNKNEYGLTDIYIHTLDCGGLYGQQKKPAIVTATHNLYLGLCTNTNKLFTGGNFNLCTFIYILYVIICAVVSFGVMYFILTSSGNSILSYAIGSLVFSLSQMLTYQVFLFSLNLVYLYAVIFATSIISFIIGVFNPGGE